MTLNMDLYYNRVAPATNGLTVYNTICAYHYLLGGSGASQVIISRFKVVLELDESRQAALVLTCPFRRQSIDRFMKNHAVHLAGIAVWRFNDPGLCPRIPGEVYRGRTHESLGFFCSFSCWKATVPFHWLQLRRSWWAIAKALAPLQCLAGCEVVEPLGMNWRLRTSPCATQDFNQ